MTLEKRNLVSSLPDNSLILLLWARLHLAQHPRLPNSFETQRDNDEQEYAVCTALWWTTMIFGFVTFYGHLETPCS